MKDLEDMQAHKVFRAFRVFVAILGQKAIPAVKAQKEIWDHRVQQEIPGQRDQSDRRATLGRRGQGESLAPPDRRDQPDHWDRRVLLDRKESKV